MKPIAMILLVWSLGGWASTVAGGPNLGQFKVLNEARRCEQPRPGQVVYAGISEELGRCLDKLAVKTVAELRITSGGGDAWESLQTARAWLGRVDLLVVDGLCASSCANYFIPMAKRVRVDAGSYVLLHGSMELALFDYMDSPEMRKSSLARLRKLNQEKATGKSEQQIEADYQAMMVEARKTLANEVHVQEEFARERLRCHDWLDPNRHLSKPIPEKYRYLLVTPVMAYRCLQITQVDAWAPPEAEKDFDPRLRLMRARR